MPQFLWFACFSGSLNRTVYASPPLAALATVCQGHSASLYSHAKPSYTQERYAKCGLNLVEILKHT
jgi:hypothetical protein